MVITFKYAVFEKYQSPHDNTSPKNNQKKSLVEKETAAMRRDTGR